MTAIQLQKDWSINPNVRNAYVSLADMSGWYIYENHAWLKTHAWTVKFTSDGSTGPTNSADTTDRLLSKTDADTRGSGASTNQSYTVLTSADGLQFMLTFQGATDDVIRLSYSPGGLFVAVPKNGVGDSFAFSSPNVTLTDAAGLFTPGDVGRTITIAGATSGGNNGSFTVASYISATQITYANASGVAEAFTGTWSITNCTFQPTATDGVVWCQGNSVINAGTSLDRVMTIWAADDGTAWSNILFRSNTTQTMLGLEKINSACAPGVFTKPYLAYRYNAFDRSPNPGGNGPTYDPHSTAAGAAGWFGGLARVFTLGANRTTRVGAGCLNVSDTDGQYNGLNKTFNSNTPALQNGTMPLLPWFPTGEQASALDGFLGTPIDWWVGYSSSLSVPAFNDFVPGFAPGDVPGVSGGQTGIGDVRTNWFVAIGSTMIRPWKNVAANIQAI